jgi:hypothetical protein
MTKTKLQSRLLQIRSRDCVACSRSNQATDWTIRGSAPDRNNGLLSSPKCSDQLSKQLNLLFNGYNGVNRPERLDNRSTSCSAQYRGIHLWRVQDNCTFTFTITFENDTKLGHKKLTSKSVEWIQLAQVIDQNQVLQKAV